MQSLILPRPDDWHVHLRDDQMLGLCGAYTAMSMGRALLMPNLKPPVRTVDEALAYRQRVLSALTLSATHSEELKQVCAATGYMGSDPSSMLKTFQPYLSLYLTQETTPADILAASQSPEVIAVKWYPMGATTHSEFGVTCAQVLESPAIADVLQAMSDTGLILCIHGEVVDAAVDIFDRERIFLESVLAPLLKKWPRLRVVLEHISTKASVDFIREHKVSAASSTPSLAASITAHHLAYDRNAMLVGGIRPHYYCLPILKRRRDREALIGAATSGDPRFFLGSDTAPHQQHLKENACGCAGVFSAPIALPLYAQVFEAANALDKLPNFASVYGAAFYGFSPNTQKIMLIKQPWTIPTQIANNTHTIVPFLAGDNMGWSINSV